MGFDCLGQTGGEYTDGNQAPFSSRYIIIRKNYTKPCGRHFSLMVDVL